LRVCVKRPRENRQRRYEEDRRFRQPEPLFVQGALRSNRCQRDSLAWYEELRERGIYARHLSQIPRAMVTRPDMTPDLGVESLKIKIVSLGYDPLNNSAIRHVSY
jgi:hypothetical protein